MNVNFEILGFNLFGCRKVVSDFIIRANQNYVNRNNNLC